MAAPRPAYNPYSAPPAETATVAENRGKRLATRGERFLGALFDGFFNFVVATTLAFVVMALDLDPLPPDPGLLALGIRMPSTVLQHICALVPAFIQWTLIARGGQSLGKKLVGTRIALADGSTAKMFNGVVLRSLPLHVLGVVPLVAQLAFGPGSLPSLLVTMVLGFVILGDLVTIFDSSYRCVHDRIAGTYVVSLKP